MTKAEQFYLSLIETGKLTVDKQGTVINTKTGNHLGSLNRKKGWLVVAQADANKKTVYILLHRLMWLVFNGPIPVNTSVVPKDGLFQNTQLDNLRLKTLSESRITNSVERSKVKLPKPEKVVRVRKPKLVKIKPPKVIKTRQEVRDGFSATKLTLDAVAQLRKDYKEGCSLLNLAAIYKVSKTTALAALTGKTWNDCPEPPAVTRKPVKKDKSEQRAPRIRKAAAAATKPPKTVTTEKHPTMCKEIRQKPVAAPPPVAPKEKPKPKVYPGRLAFLASHY
jgi:hypothetical protein